MSAVSTSPCYGRVSFSLGCACTVFVDVGILSVVLSLCEMGGGGGGGDGGWGSNDQMKGVPLLCQAE